MFRVRQRWDRPRVADVEREVDLQLGSLELGEKVRPGQTVAISVGSRGIRNIALIIKAAVAHLRELGAKPFIVPAMGSHGGGTAEGQRAVVESLGVTEDFVGCPIRATMETVVVCETDLGVPVHFDRHAFEADHVLVCGRVKPHTLFVGDIESGLMKMMLIGLGKRVGATIYHRAIQDYSFQEIIQAVVDRVLSRCHILAGLAIVENAYDETARIRAVAPGELVAREKELLVQAKKWMPRLPFDTAHLLIVDEIGKNISGSGMDTNVIGRKFGTHQAGPDEFPKVKHIVVRGLTEESHGNATGIGLAEYCTTRLIEQMDVEATRINCLTAGRPTGAMVPISFDSDREILDAALPAIGLTAPADARVIWIRNTLHLAEVECSAAYWEEARERADLEIISERRELVLDTQGNFVPFEPALAAG